VHQSQPERTLIRRTSVSNIGAEEQQTLAPRNDDNSAGRAEPRQIVLASGNTPRSTKSGNCLFMKCDRVSTPAQ